MQLTSALERGIYKSTKIDNRKQYNLWLCWQPDQPPAPVPAPEVHTPTPRKRVTKREVKVKQEVSQEPEVKQEAEEEPQEPSPAASTLQGSTPPSASTLLASILAPVTPQTMTTLPKRPRVVSSEPATPTRAPKAKRVGAPKGKRVGAPKGRHVGAPKGKRAGARTRAQKEQDPEEDT